MQTLSEARVSDKVREELSRAVEARTPMAPPSTTARDEVTKAAVKFTDGVDVITESLLLILEKFRGIIWRTNIGMIFGACVLLTSIEVVRAGRQTALVQENNTKRIAELAARFEEASKRLDSIQASTVATEKVVEEVKQTAEAKPSIEIVPDKGRPGGAKVVIRSRPAQSSKEAKPSSSAAPNPVTAALAKHGNLQVIEIPLALPRKAPEAVAEAPGP